jgi:hypothetical protein
MFNLFASEHTPTYKELGVCSVILLKLGVGAEAPQPNFPTSQIILVFTISS